MALPRSRRPFVRTLLLVCSFTAGVLAYGLSETPDDSARELMATTSQVGEAPVAVIGYLPDSVSNVSEPLTLNAMASYDPDGNITSYLWTVEHEGSFVNLTKAIEPYSFEETGLHKITLTVTDNDNNIGRAFTAVYSFSDADNDDLPDWWEVKYLDSRTYDAEDDPDEDGYNNLEEYARHSDPLVADSKETFLDIYWREMAVVAAIVIVASALIYRRYRRKRKDEERRKIEYAIEIQKALDEE